jgi:Cdc6-like AAA superfamily ATPase
VAETPDETGGDQPSERLQRLAALEQGNAQERELYARAASEFVDSEAFRALNSGLSPVAAQKELLAASDAVVDTVEADRAALRTAVVETYQALRLWNGAIRSLIVLALIVGVVAYAASALIIAEVFPATTAVVGSLTLLVALTRIDLVGRSIRTFIDARQARASTRRDLSAAEELFVRALTRYGFPEHIQSLRSGSLQDNAAGHRTVTPTDPMHLAPFKAQHLVEIYSAGQQIQTRARDALTDLVDGLTGASIGVAGPRGVGKTTLLRWFFDKQVADFDCMALCIPAPVRYQPRDFVLTVFSQLCESVAGTRRVLALSATRRAILTSTTTAAVGILVTVVGVVLYLVPLKLTPSTQQMIALGLIVIGVVLVIVRTVAVLRIPEEQPDYLSVPLIRTRPCKATAAQLLREIRFQLTFSTGYSGKLTPGIAELGADTSYSLAANQESFPEVVARFQAFLESVAEERGRVFIGIDELDKLSAQDAVRFLDDVKGFFGVPGCFFIVSISEDALGQFERRGVPMRDTFDSAFDEVMRVETLRCDESINLLAKRGVSHDGLASLCHVLSGGIPRDLIRHARQLARISGGHPTLADAARELVARDIIEKTDGVRIAVTSEQGLPEQIGFTEWLCDLGRASKPEDMLDVVEPYAPRDNGNCSDVKAEDWVGLPRDFAERLACLVLVDATALQLVALDENGALSALLGEANQLAEARLQITTSIHSAWARCVEVRTRRGLARMNSKANAGTEGGGSVVAAQ